MPTFQDWLKKFHDWSETDTATEPGWYALLITYGDGENNLAADFWRDGAWSNYNPAAIAYRSPMTFASHEEAIDWAIAHDPDW